MAGRLKLNRNANQNVAIRGLTRSYYSSIHEVVVRDVQMEAGTVSIDFADGTEVGATSKFPLTGISLPSDAEGNVLVGKAAWGVYFPQVGDRFLIGFDARGAAYTLSYSSSMYPSMDAWDRAYSEQGGIGWGVSSGKYLKPGDWSWKSSRNSSLYLGDKVGITSGAMSITLDSPNNLMRTSAQLMIDYYGSGSQLRAGSVMRFMVPGVDTQESFVPESTTGFTGQEYSNYVKRMSYVPVGGVLSVRISYGDVVDDNTNVLPSAPTLFASTLAATLTGVGTRVLLAVMDDVSGKIPTYTQVVDNLGNYGVEALTATGFGWNTPLAKWSVLNNSLELTTTLNAKWTVGTKFEVLSGAEASITAGAKMDITAGAALTIKAPSISLASGSISLGASPCALSCSDALSVSATSITLGTGNVEPLVKFTTFNAAMSALLSVLNANWTTLAAACGAPPLTPLAGPFTTMAAAAVAASTALKNATTVITKAG